MGTAIAFLTSGKAKWIGLGIVAVIAGLYVGFLHLRMAGYQRTIAQNETKIERLSSDLETARQNVATAQAVNRENVATIETLRADYQRASDLAEAIRQSTATRSDQARIVYREITRVVRESPAQCPIADSVQLVLDGLRERSAARGADSGESRTGQGQPAK